MADRTIPLIGGRYEIKSKLGAGAMGAVYLTLDRLTGETIALKRVLLGQEPTISMADTMPASPPDKTVPQTDEPIPPISPGHPPVDPNQKQILLQAIAGEFQTLASLRHPHIISVLDYGFDQESPYFTMSYLDTPQTILQAAENSSPLEKVELIQQMLEALTYLHQRGILHHDLKPDNVLVTDNQVKVLDFGLASAKGSEVQGGTLFYMAPEVLQRGEITEGLDLYAVGVMAYQIFAGKLPFAGGPAFILDVLTELPDLSALPVGDELKAVVGKLLEKDPQDRYATAYDTMVAFSEAVGTPLPPEDLAVRESFLQAATFVGREAEMSQLLDSLAKSQKGEGQAWLIAGHSGVGKSRLVRELRIQALIQGVLVIQGQAIQEGALPYQLWRNPLRRLVLLHDLTDIQAGVLKQLIPDLPRLLERDIPDAPALDNDAAQQRLLSVITSLLQQQEQPIFLLLEDLQWGSTESLAVLQQLLRIMDREKVFVVGSYRPEERPHLPDQLPQAQLMSLQPLTPQAMLDLSLSMLGEGGQQPEIIDFLQRETEGNAFFLVEVVRTLAEEAGRLRQIGQMVLPETVFPDGIRTVIQRRLQTIPMWAHPLLQLVAIAGRQLDSQLLPQLAPHINLYRWLAICSQRAILERQGGQWQLSHDKIREGILRELTATEKIPLHQQVAQAIEHTYPNDPDHAAALTHHWSQAQNTAKERTYAQQAGEHAASQYAHDDALTYLNRALQLTPASDPQSQYDLLMSQEYIHDWRGQREEQANTLAQLQTLISHLNNTQHLDFTLRQANYALAINDYEQVVTQTQAVIEKAQASINHTKQAAIAHYLWGKALSDQVSRQTARPHFEQAYELAQQIGYEQEALKNLFELGNIDRIEGRYDEAQNHLNRLVEIGKTNNYPLAEIEGLIGLVPLAVYQGNLTQAKHYCQQALIICRQIGHRLWETDVLNHLATVVMKSHEYDIAQEYYKQQMHIVQAMNNQARQQAILNQLGFLAWKLGNHEQAKLLYTKSLKVAQHLGLQQMESMVLINLGHTIYDEEDYSGAQTHYEKALNILHGMDEQLFLMSYAFYGLGIVTYVLGEYEQAKIYYQRSLSLSEQSNNDLLKIENLAGLAQVDLIQGNLTKAQQSLNEVLTYQQRNPAMHGAERPFRVLLICYQVLQALGDSQADFILQDSYRLLIELSQKLADKRSRKTFLENVPEHQEIVSTYHQKYY